MSLLTDRADRYQTRLTTQYVARACVAAVAYIGLFAVLDALLETHAETGQQKLVRLIVVSVALVGALGVLMHVYLRARAAQEESDRRIQAVQEEARLEGAMLTIRELAPWVAPNASRQTANARTRSADHSSASATQGLFPAASKLLTTREREVALLIAQGRTSREIAEALVITERTADTHADRIRAKLGLHSRAEIVAWVLTQGPSVAPAKQSQIRSGIRHLP